MDMKGVVEVIAKAATGRSVVIILRPWVLAPPAHQFCAPQRELTESANRQTFESGFHFLHYHFPFCFPARNISGIIFPYVIRTICNRLQQKCVFLFNKLSPPV